MKHHKQQVGGSHYKRYGYQPLQFAEEVGLTPTLTLVLRYLAREKEGAVDDPQKALHLLKWFEAEGTKVFWRNIGLAEYVRLVRKFTRQFQGGRRIKLELLLSVNYSMRAALIEQLEHEIEENPTPDEGA